MIVAQLAIPLAAAVAALFAAWFALDILLRTRPGEAVTAVAEAARESGSAFLWRLVALSMTAALAAGAGLGALAGVSRESAETGVVAGLAVVAGALAATLTAGAGVALGQRASERAAAAADRTLRQALAITLWAGAAPALAGGALAVAGVAALYGVATRFADIPGGEAAFLALGVGAGAALTALAARLLAASQSAGGDDGDDDGPEAEALESAANAASGAETIALIAAGGGAGLALGEPLSRMTGEDAWLVAPLVVLALGLAAATIAAITLPFWARALRNAGRSAVAGYAIAAVLGGALAFLAPAALLEEGRWWFAGAALTGAGMSALLFLAGRAIVGDGSGYRGTGAAFVLLAAIALVAAFALGWQAGIAGVSQTATALYGAALAAAGALALAPAALAARSFGSAAANAAALAERAREAAPPPEGDADAERPPPMPLGPLTATARRALAPAWVHPLGWTALAGAVALGALLLAVRAELGNVAADDVPRYVRLASELGVTPEFEEFQAEAAYELAVYRDLLERRDVAAPDLPQLLLAGEEEARRLLAMRAGEGRLGEEVAAIGGGPLPFPSLPPLRLDRLAGAGALLALTALLGAIGLTAERRLRARAPIAILVAAAVPVAGALIARPLAGGNAGWEMAAGGALAALAAGLALAAWGGGKHGGGAATGLSLAIWLGASGAVIAPALLAS